MSSTTAIPRDFSGSSVSPPGPSTKLVRAVCGMNERSAPGFPRLTVRRGQRFSNESRSPRMRSSSRRSNASRFGPGTLLFAVAMRPLLTRTSL